MSAVALTRASPPSRDDQMPRRRDATCATVARYHVMEMSNEEIIVPNRARSGRSSRAAFGGAQAPGPIIDQDGREIPAESLGPRVHGFRFEFGNGASPFGNLTHEQRLARLDAVAKLLDIAFILPGTNVRYGIDGIIGVKSGWTSEAKSCLVAAAFRSVRRQGVLVISVALGQPGGPMSPARLDEALLATGTKALVAYRFAHPGATVATALSLWLVREARALGAPWHITARMLGNVAIQGVVGAVPVAGDAFDVLFRANIRNVRMLRRWMDKHPLAHAQK